MNNTMTLVNPYLKNSRPDPLTKIYRVIPVRYTENIDNVVAKIKDFDPIENIKNIIYNFIKSIYDFFRFLYYLCIVFICW